MPNGIAGGNLGAVLVPANHFSDIGEQRPNENAQPSRNAGFGESGLDNQSFLANRVGLAGISGSNKATVGIISSANEMSVDGDSSFATDGHAIEGGDDRLVQAGQPMSSRQTFGNVSTGRCRQPCRLSSPDTSAP